MNSYSASNENGVKAKWHWFGLAVDVATALLTTLVVFLLCEWFIRRREGRKP